MTGYLSLVLHAHLPFVRHPEHEDFLEEDWLYEAISETYLPLLGVFDRLLAEGVRFRLAMTLSPTLVSMLRDELLMKRYAAHLDRICELTGREVRRTRSNAAFLGVARFYQHRFAAIRAAFHQRYQRDLVAAFADLQEVGCLEIITCCATHAFLPLLINQPEALWAQIAVGVDHHRRAFGRDPAGIWLPECGYCPGVERMLAECGIRFFFLDSHGLLRADPPPVFSLYAPVYTRAGVAAFARDPESSEEVWSAKHGYPSNPAYRDFYRDIGWDLEYSYMRPYIQPNGQRKNTGLKYFRITGATDSKQPYDPPLAAAQALVDASDFVSKRRRQLESLSTEMANRQPIVTAPYDAELFGHWWFEGPAFLEAVLRASACDDANPRLVTPSDYLREHPEQQVATPSMSSWGERGYASTWLDESNDWIYPHLQLCAEQMVQLARDFAHPTAVQRRALNQAARELLLAQSSDWAFIMKTGTAVEYAIRRTQGHLRSFESLRAGLRQGGVDEGLLQRLEARHNLFPDLDYRVYCSAGRLPNSAALPHEASRNNLKQAPGKA
jgi:1,4-alpha-glucan branching enzyme